MSFFKKLASKPWLPDQIGTMEGDTEGFDVSNQKVVLIAFMAVVGVIFFLFFAAYHMRIELSDDWVAMPEPPLLWVNTGILVLCSIAFEWARGAANRGGIGALRKSFVIAGLLTFAFLAGQLVVWRQLLDLGYAAQSNPSNAFFYMITAAHAAHLLGGLVAWGRATGRMFRSDDVEDSRSIVDLCTIYWHFLLLVWLGMFALLMNT